MKRLILILALFCSIVCNAQVNRVLTSDEKMTLAANARFQFLCRQAILDKAAYWTGLDGTVLPGGQTAVTLARWAKSRLKSQALIQVPLAITDADVQQFMIFLKTMILWDNAVSPFNTDTLCNYMIAQSKFDALADNWMDQKIRYIDF